MMREDGGGLMNNGTTGGKNFATLAPRPSPQLPPENVGLSKTPSPRSSPSLFLPINNGTTDARAGALSPMSCTKDRMYFLAQQNDRQPSLNAPINATSSSSKVSGISIKVEESSKEVESPKIGGNTKKSGSSTLTPLEVTSFQKRLFGLQHSANSRKSYTLPPTFRLSSSKETSTSTWPLKEPVLSPVAIVTDSTIPPPEPVELQYFEVHI